MTILETRRTVLRRMEAGDVDDLLGIFSDPEAMRYHPGTKGREQAEDWVRQVQQSYSDHGFGLWTVTRKDSGEFAGQCGLTVQKVEGIDEVEIGYLFLRRFWGSGLTTETARACRDYGFGTLGFERLVSLIDPGNAASRKVAEKVGMTMEREVDKWSKTVCLYSMSKTHRQPAP